MPRDTPKEFRICGAGAAVAIQAAEAPADGPAKLARFEGNAYTGAPMRPDGWWNKIIVDLAGVKVSSQTRPALRQHDHQQIVGHTDSVKVNPAGKDQGVIVAGVLSGEQQHVDKVAIPAANGFPWQLSIGANPVRTEFLEAGEEATVNGRTITGPMTISRETELGEISFVPLGADGDTSATVTGSKGEPRMDPIKAMLKDVMADAVKAGKAAKYSDSDIDDMDETKAKAALKKCMKAADDDDEDDKKKSESQRRADVQAMFKAESEKAMKAQREAAAAEEGRQNAIRATAQQYGVTDIDIPGGDGKPQRVKLVAHAIAAGWTPDVTELHALRAARPQAGGVVPGGHVYSTHTPEITEAVLEAAALDAMRCDLFHDDFFTRETKERDRVHPRVASRVKAELNTRYPDQVRQAAHTHFRGRIGLQQLLTHIAAGNGYRGRETISADNYGEVATYCNPPVIRADGGSTISVQNVTANVQNKMMLQGYLFTEQAWREIAGIRSVKDFKPTKSINLFGDVEFKEIPNTGELSNASLQDQAFANQARSHGRIITIGRTVIINDDLGAFGQVPMLMGRGAGLKLNTVFWIKFLNPGKDDGGSTNFFASTHTLPAGQSGNANYMSGGSSALSSSSLGSATLLFDNQIDPKGYPLGFDAEILLFPPDLETAALELMNSEWIIMGGLASTASASKQPSSNRWKGRYRPVKSRYLNKTLTDTVLGVSTTGTGSTTAWYLLANPGVLPVIELAFLDGVDTPTVQTAGPDFQFNILGISTRAYFDMDANMQNFRGGVQSAGA